VALLLAAAVAVSARAPALPGAAGAADFGPQLVARAQAQQRLASGRADVGVPVGSLSPAERKQVVDAYWGPGVPIADKLRIFDTFWTYADQHYAAFQGIQVDWEALRARYRAEVAAGVSRGRFAAIMNQLSLALHDAHTLALDLDVNIFTTPARGVPLLAQGAWEVDLSGACLTAQDDGSALVYSAMPNHPLGLEPGDRVLGYDGRPWVQLYQELLAEGVPMWPLWWGSSPSAFDHSFVMSAGLNWSLFTTMDILKHDSGQIVHIPTSRMPGDLFYGFCAEELNVPGVAQPGFFDGQYVSSGIVQGTNTGYVYVWAWAGTARDDFAAAVHQLTQVDHVDGLILDFRFNVGGFVDAPFNGLAELFSAPHATIAMDGRRRPDDHLAMKTVLPASDFLTDFAYDDAGKRTRDPSAYPGPVAVLVGPGAVSAGDIGAYLATFLPNVRTFGESTSMALGLPTQASLGTALDLGPDWFARVAETNSARVSQPLQFLTHTEFPVDEPVWLRPDDVAVGRDTVAAAALQWLDHQRVG
jgi:C-terminal processing protease CtpA/Prc